MTLIVTVFNRYGVVNSSDSNIASEGMLKEGRKTFEIPGLHAGLTMAGTRSIGGMPIEPYMDLFLRSHTHSVLADFSVDLYDQIQVDLQPDEAARLILIQIGGYQQHADGWHPELWFIRNAAINQVSGEYEQLPDLMLTEDFWAVDCPKHRLLERFALGKSRYYFNGFPAGRIGFASLVPQFEDFFEKMWNEPTWKFRPPANLAETAMLVEHFMRTVSISSTSIKA